MVGSPVMLVGVLRGSHLAVGRGQALLFWTRGNSPTASSPAIPTLACRGLWGPLWGLYPALLQPHGTAGLGRDEARADISVLTAAVATGLGCPIHPHLILLWTPTQGPPQGSGSIRLTWLLECTTCGPTSGPWSCCPAGGSWGLAPLALSLHWGPTQL